MAKPRTTISVRLPLWVTPRNAWRRRIVAAIEQARTERRVYQIEGQVELLIRLYVRETKKAVHDVDNRLKDIMDALQGRLGGSKARRRKWRLIDNDSQVCRVEIVKMPPPKQSHGLGHLVIRRFIPAQ